MYIIYYIYIYGPVSGGPSPPGMVGWACTSQSHGLSLMYLCFFPNSLANSSKMADKPN